TRVARVAGDRAAAAVAAAAALPTQLTAGLGHAALAVIVDAGLAARTRAAVDVDAAARVFDHAAAGLHCRARRRVRRALAGLVDADLRGRADAAVEPAAAAVAERAALRVLELAGRRRARLTVI